MLFKSLFQKLPAGAASEDCAERKAVRTLRATATALPVPFLEEQGQPAPRSQGRQIRGVRIIGQGFYGGGRQRGNGHAPVRIWGEYPISRRSETCEKGGRNAATRMEASCGTVLQSGPQPGDRSIFLPRPTPTSCQEPGDGLAQVLELEGLVQECIDRIVRITDLFRIGGDHQNWLRRRNPLDSGR